MEITAGLTAWFEDVALGLACTALDGYDLCPLYGQLPALGEGAHRFIDRTIARPAATWLRPLDRMLLRRKRLDGELVPRLDAPLVEALARHDEAARQAAVRRWRLAAGMAIAAPTADDAAFEEQLREAADGGDRTAAGLLAALEGTSEKDGLLVFDGTHLDGRSPGSLWPDWWAGPYH